MTNKPISEPEAMMADTFVAMAAAHRNLRDLTEVYRSAYEEAKQDGLVNWEAATSLNVENEENKRKVAALERQLAAERADKRRMDWLVSHYVEVRTPLVYGSHALFVAQVVSEDWAEEHATSLREQIDAAMKAAGLPVEGE
ncbi:hypothetical protein AO825_08465 [Pectobacterium brasiliense]|uniref:hypothetical protein n=1 Tax=Pectobacterium brasiliense TaxID=180957 RepID=UPI0001A444C8|nr:hypothetical protein [Pectobacterium brasiliense]KRF62884.1 hypothetical protein AO825_08465 [Pectobacterium brasiliense]MBN3186096.1 hypothetical protein [Pectobacterium brasiliense]QHG26926.1 hypothetical protein GT391_02015 [Pectobacterium brasiliense]